MTCFCLLLKYLYKVEVFFEYKKQFQRLQSCTFEFNPFAFSCFFLFPLKMISIFLLAHAQENIKQDIIKDKNEMERKGKIKKNIKRKKRKEKSAKLFSKEI